MMHWWNSLPAVAQWFYVAALFFSGLFIWQLVMTLLGFGGGADSGLDHDVPSDGHFDHADMAHAETGEVAATMVAFKLVSVRSILAFCTLFTWAAALHLSGGMALAWAMLHGLGWGLAAMLIVAGIFYLFARMTEQGNLQMSTCVGKQGSVYLDIPAGGQGEVRVTVSNRVSVVRARGVGGAAIKSGTPVRVVRLINESTIEVEPQT